MARSDFNGDGRSDVLWLLRVNEAVSNWIGTPTGGFIVNDSNAYNPLNVMHSFNFATTGDFNGDGRSDVLWLVDNSSYSINLVRPDGGFSIGEPGPGFEVADKNWRIAGAGDFNGDGIDDLLWRHDDGRISNWLGQASGSFLVNDAQALDTLLRDWPIQGIGDFNGDGRGDIVTRHASGTLNLSLGSPAGRLDHEDPFGQVSSDWSIAGVGDFNGDGRDDLLWRNAGSGAVSDWLFAGGLGQGTFTINDGKAFRQASLDWQVAGTGDFNGDGRDDILWFNPSTRQVSNWLAQGDGSFFVNDAIALATVPPGFQPSFNLSGAGFWDY